MDFVIDFEGRVGMRQKGKWWKVIDDHTCFLADKKIEILFHIVRDWTKTAGLSFYDRKAHTGLLRYAVLRATTHGQTMVNIVTSAPENSEEEALVQTQLESLAEKTQATTVLWSVNHTITDVSFADDIRIISGDGVIEEIIADISYLISPNAFFQTNSHGAATLLETVLEFAGDIEGKRILDLYCGTGFFALAFAKNGAKDVLGVELNPKAIEDAKQNAIKNQLDVEFHDAKTEEYDWSQANADLVILDPPRSGMHDNALKDVLKNAPNEIIYISCHYKNFAREMVLLQELYDIEHMRAIDMFPHTPHVELVTKLVKKK